MMVHRDKNDENKKLEKKRFEPYTHISYTHVMAIRINKKNRWKCIQMQEIY